MSETKSYGISLNFSDRITLFISGALSWRQFKNNDTFYIQQSEIQILNAPKFIKKFTCLFERDHKMHYLVLDKTSYASLYKDNQSLLRSHFLIILTALKYQLSGIFAMFATDFLIDFSTDFLKASTFANFYLSGSCDSQCADLMAKYKSISALFLLYTLGIPIFYFSARYFSSHFYKFKFGPHPMELAWLVFVILVKTMFLNYSFNHAQAESVLNHWKNGTLNQTTIAKIESEFKSKTAAKRATAAASEKATE